jgi:uncharacterized membrane protein
MLNKVRSWKLEVGSIRKKSILFGIFFFFFGICSYAQCAMCRASLESEGDATKNEALNNGIVYLMAIPYLLVGIVGFVVYRIYRNKTKA